MKKLIFIFTICLSLGVGYFSGRLATKNELPSPKDDLKQEEFSSISPEDSNMEFNSPPPEVPVVEELKDEEPLEKKFDDKELEARRIKNELEKLGFSAALGKDKKGRSIAKVQAKSKKVGKANREMDNLVDEVEWTNYGTPEETNEDDDKVDLSTDHK